VTTGGLTANELSWQRDFDGECLLARRPAARQKAGDTRESDNGRSAGVRSASGRRRIYHDWAAWHAPSGGRARSADKKVVQPMLLLATLMLSVGLSLAISRIFLGCVLHVMTHGGLADLSLAPVIFVTALFWIWYLTPAIAASHAPTRVIHLLLH
jgi:hypothetical protein